MGFTKNKAASILGQQINADTYVCLLIGEPDMVSGSGLNEPPTSAGYKRVPIGKLNTSKVAQIANEEYIFIFEATAECGTVTHVGLSDGKNRGDAVFFAGAMTTPLPINKDYVPLIRPYKLIVGLDVEKLDTAYGD